MVKCTKSHVRKLKTVLMWKLPASQSERIQMVLLRESGMTQPAIARRSPGRGPPPPAASSCRGTKDERRREHAGRPSPAAKQPRIEGLLVPERLGAPSPAKSKSERWWRLGRQLWGG